MSINLTQTTTSAAMTALSNQLPVASATGISAPSGGFRQKLYVIDPCGQKGELMDVLAVNGLQITVGRLDQFKTPHGSGSIVLIGNADPILGSGFQEFDPVGTPASAPTVPLPWVNVVTGAQWLPGLNNNWVPGFNNPKGPAGCTALVASAAGVILPSGPMFHVNGQLAITGLTIPVGYAGGPLVIIPDDTFTWTAAGNIALAGSAVISKALRFEFDPAAAKPFFPSYVA